MPQEEGYIEDSFGRRIKFTPVDRKAPRNFKGVYDPLLICSNFNGKEGGKPLHEKEVNGKIIEVRGRINGGEFFKELKTKYPDLKKYTDVEIKGMIRRFNENLVDVVIDYKDGIVLPLNCGMLFVATFGKASKNIDLNRSSEENRLCYYNNEHSENYGGGVYYSTQWNNDFHSYSRNMFVNARYWSFEPGRRFRKKLCEAYKTDWKRYWVLTTTRRVSDLVYSYKKKNKAKKLSEIILRTSYDEFKF